MSKVKGKKISNKILKNESSVKKKKGDIFDGIEPLKKKDDVSKKTKKVKSRKIREKNKYVDIEDKEETLVVEKKVSVDSIEDKLDRDTDFEEELSVGLMIFIFVCCLILGFVVGYITYRLIF